MNSYLLGVITGILISVLNVVLYKKEVVKKTKNILSSKKATIVELEDPVDKIVK